MVKESNPTSIKKRRKNVTSGDHDGDHDVYKKVVTFEEKEALDRKTDEDASIYFETANKIRQLFTEIHKLKNEKTPDARQKILERCTEACVLIAVLKKLNRLDKFRSIAARDVLIIEKQKVDSTNLQYHNLLYESNHIIAEYTKCKQFKSKDDNIDLISEEEFFKEAPESLTKPLREPNATMHDVRLALLEWELQQRKNLAKQCSSFEEEKKQVAAEIVERKNRLDGLGPRLTTVIEATKPLQEHLGLPIDKIQAEHKLASLLPDPLYLVYANSDAYKQVYDLDMNVEILGDQDEALQWKEQQKITSIQLHDDSDAETDLQDVEENAEVKKRHHRKSSHVNRMEEKKNKLLEVHPLSVQITMKVKDGPTLKINMLYYIQLKIVCVTSNSEIPDNITGNTAQEVLSGESLLRELLEGDFGIKSPNSSNHFQLQKMNLGSFESLVHKLGFAYIWAQKVCGLDFLATQDTKDSSNKLSLATVELVMKSIYRRLKSRTALALQLQQLEQNIIPAVPEKINCPRIATSNLTKWASSDWQQFCHSPSTKVLLENEIVNQNNMFYMATITRLSVNLQTYVVVKNDYPLTAPIFSLCLKLNGVVHHAGNSDDIRDMERAVNTEWNCKASSASWLLSVQLRYLCSCLDVYLETTEPATFVQNTVFFRHESGRNRRRPFKFRKIGAGIFTQH